jgi:hypothetical protein
MIKTAISDRRLWLLGLVLVLVVLVSRWAIPTSTGLRTVVFSGYWLALALTVFFARAVIPVIRRACATATFNRFDVWVVAGVVATSAVWAAHEKPGYKVLQDELMLLGTSMGMHYERLAAYPNRATDVQGAFQILNRVLDKRPLFFPFLTATVHDLTGYRPENPFYLNMVLGAGFLWLVYLFGRAAAGGSQWAGLLAMLLFAGLPLLAQQATGGGFELLNLLLIVCFALLVVKYLDQPGETALEALIFCTLLLASTRYESALFLIPAAVATWCGWRRAGRVVLTWPLILSPVFLAPLLMQNRIFADQPEAWQMQSLQGITTPFGFQYLAPNLGHALAFFFDFSGYQPNSSVFAALGLAALPFFGLWIVRGLRGQVNRPDTLAWVIVGCSLFAIASVYLLYFWGQFDSPIIRRLSLPVHLLMALSIIVIAAQMFKSSAGWKVGCGVVAIGMVLQSLPTLATQAYRTLYSPGVQMELRAEFLHGLTDKNILFIDNDSPFWITHRIPASPIKQAQLRKEGILYHLKNHSFTDIFVFQTVDVDGDTGKMSVHATDELGADFVLEPVLERRVVTLQFARISRIKAIKQNGETIVESPRIVTPVTRKKSAEDLDKARSRYLENWIKQLP